MICNFFQGLIPGQVDISNVRSYLDSLGKQLSPEAQQLLESMESKQMVGNIVFLCHNLK